MPWLRSSANKVQTNVFCCCLIVNYGVALHRTCYTIVCRNRHGIFWGLIFSSGIFWGFAGSPREFFGSWLLAPFDHPRHLKSWVPPPPLGDRHYIDFLLGNSRAFTKGSFVLLHQNYYWFKGSVILLFFNGTLRIQVTSFSTMSREK